MQLKWVIKGYPYKFARGAPSVSDTNYPDSFVWVDVIANIAYVLSNGVWMVKNPDSVIDDGMSQINVIGETNAGKSVRSPGIEIISGIISDPGSGEYKIKSLRMDSTKKIVVTYEDTPK